MRTVTIQIGNTDNKLTQQEWAQFVQSIHKEIATHASIHFFGGPANWESWQNAAWIVNCEDEKLAWLKAAVAFARKTFNQDSAAWTEGESEFI